MPTPLTHWAWGSRTFVSSNAFKMSFISHANPSVINNYLVVPPFCRSFFFIYLRLINAICTCWTTHAYNCCDDNYVSTKEGVIFGERLIYLRSHNTRCFWSSYGLIISSVFSDNEEKVLKDYLDCSVNLFIKSSL